MPWFQETTQWTNPQQRNHFYLLSENRSKLYAYVKFGLEQPQVFTKLMSFDVRGRRFVKIQDRWHIKLDQPTVNESTWSVSGSRGDNYTVSKENQTWTCTCSGFTFRGRCKHIEQIKSQNKSAK